MAENNFDTKFSKKLAYLLRHGAIKAGLNIKPNGFVEVKELLSKKLQGFSLKDIERVVKTNDKNRFLLCVNNGILEIKANQGHSLSEINELNLVPIHQVNFDIIHGTYFDKWKLIRIEGLLRMNRNHIHFSKGINFICGLRKNAEVFIYIDFDKAIRDNIQFHESENGVILSTGDSSGRLEPKYFRKVVSKCDLHDDYAYQGHLQGKKHLKNVEFAEIRNSLIQKSIFVRLPPRMQQQDLIQFFMTFGQISRYRFGPNYLIVEYTRREPVNFLLSRPVVFAGRRLEIKRRIVHDNSKGPKKENNKEKEEISDTSELSYNNIKSVLEEKVTFDDQLEYLLNEIQLSNKDVEKLYESICTHLDDIFLQVFPNCKAYRFGSTVSGLALKKSDLDIYMDIGVTISETDNRLEWNMRRVFTEAKRLMYRKNQIFGKIVPIPRAKMPIIKFCHIPTNISCDLSFKNSLGVHNSLLIRHYLSFDSRLKPTMMVLKYWAKEFEITRTGRISNYSLVMLFIFYLQQPLVVLVPSVLELRKPCTPEVIEGWQVNFDTNFYYANQENTSIVPELLHGFFEFYANFNYDGYVICPMDGIAHPKSVFEKLENLPESMMRFKEYAEKQDGALGVFGANRIMCVQDPNELNHNITMNVSRQMLDHFRKQCSVAAEVCISAMKTDDLHNLLPKLFSCTEPLRGKKKSRNSMCQIIIPGNEFLRVGLPADFDTRNIFDKEQCMRKNWYAIVLRCVRDIFERVFKFQIQTYAGALKQQKVDATSDVHSSDNEKVVFNCTSSYCMWRERKSKKFVATQGMSPLEKEISISDALMKEKQSKGEKADSLLDFTCSFERTENPDQVIVTLVDRNCSKKNFQEMIPFIRSKLASLVFKIMLDMMVDKKQ